jgi:hypothetical protein
MRFVRVTLALVIVLSVAMLPMAVSAAPMISPTSQAEPEVVSANVAAPAEMAAAMQMSAIMDDCCPDRSNKNTSSDQPSDHCPPACCAVSAVSIADAAVFQFDFPILAANPLPIPVDQVVALHSGSPPFRPPRV